MKPGGTELLPFLEDVELELIPNPVPMVPPERDCDGLLLEGSSSLPLSHASSCHPFPLPAPIPALEAEPFLLVPFMFPALSFSL